MRGTERQGSVIARRLAVAIIMGALSIGIARAQEFPVRPVTLIIPFPAGGGTDIAVRAIAEAAARHLGQSIIIDNRAGAAGASGPAVMAATSKPDGYTISQMPIGVFRVPIMQKTTWDPEKDFTYIINLSGYVTVTFASMQSGFRSWKDVVEFARKNPGKVTYATSGAGSSGHIGMAQIATHEGIQLTHVPFKGAAEGNVAVAGGHTMLGASGSSAKLLADAGKVRILNVWTENRSEIMPDVPTLKEEGLPYVFDSPYGIAGPKGMDPKVVAKLHDAFKKALDDPEVRKTLDKFGMVPNYKGSEDYAKFVAEFMASERETFVAIGMARKD